MPKPHNPSSSALSTSSAIPPPLSATHLERNLGLRPDQELGLLSLLFAVSVVDHLFTNPKTSFAFHSYLNPIIGFRGCAGSCFVHRDGYRFSSNAEYSFRELGISVDKLSKLGSEEVPGTLCSLKLSGLEIHELTQQLCRIRKIIPGNRVGKDGKPKNRRSNGREGKSLCLA